VLVYGSLLLFFIDVTSINGVYGLQCIFYTHPVFRGELLALVGSAPSLPLLSPPLLTSPLPLEVGPLKSS